MSEAANTKKSLPLWRRIALGLIILAIAVLAAVMLANPVIEKRLDGRIVALSKAGLPVSFEQLASASDTSPTKDASMLYQSAMRNLPALDMDSLGKIFTSYRSAIGADALDQFPKNFHLAIAQILKSHQTCLTNLDKAAKLPLSDFDIGIQHGQQACKKTLIQARQALTLLSLRTTILLGANQYDLAAESTVSLLKATRIFDTYPIIMVSKAKLHFIKLACDDIRMLVSYGKPSDAMLEELVSTLTETVSHIEIRNSLLAEQVYQIETLRHYFSEKIAADYLQKDISDMPERANLPGTSLGKLRLRWFVLRYFGALDELIKTSSKPMPVMLEYVNEDHGKGSGKLKPIVANIHAFIETSMETTALARSTLLTLHVEKYRRIHGSVPDSLQQISENIDSQIMTDPCSAEKMKLIQNEHSYSIYSTGLDRVDHGGATRAQISKTGTIEKKPEDLGIQIIIQQE